MLKECNFYNFINLSTPFTSKIETKDKGVFCHMAQKIKKITLNLYEIWPPKVSVILILEA